MFAAQEEALSKYVLETGDRIGTAPLHPHRICMVSNKSLDFAQMINAEQDGVQFSLCSISATFDDLLSSSIQTVKVGTPGKQFDAEHLSQNNTGIDIHTARRTVKATTQRGIRTLLHPTLSRRFRTNDRQLRYRRLPIDCFTDTLISNTISARGNNYAQIFVTSDGWCRAYPMRKKSQAHEGLSLTFQREGVPNTLIMDNSKEQLLGEFRKKCLEASARVKQTEPHTPWSNSAEAAIRELK